MRTLNILDNALKVMAEPMEQMESVSIGVWIRAGGRYENTSNSGISHVLEHMLFKGTKTRDMKTIKQMIEGRGGSFNGFTSEEYTCYWVKLLAKDAELGVDILSDMVFNSNLDADELAKEKSVIIEEINMYKDMPAQHVHEILSEMMWPGQPLGMPLAGTIKSVKAITRDAVVSYKETYYHPKNMLLIAAGNISEDTLVRAAKKYVPGASTGKKSEFKKVVIRQKKPAFILNSKDTEQTHIALGVHATDRFHPERYALSLLNILMGANMSSRLFHIVRDEMALCYEISSDVQRFDDSGAFVVSAGVDHKKLNKALEVILRELVRIRTEPVSADELRRAKEYCKGQFLFGLENTTFRMHWLGEKVVANEKELDPKVVLKKIEAVTAEDVIRVAKSIFKDENLNLAVIGPIKEEDPIREALHF